MAEVVKEKLAIPKKSRGKAEEEIETLAGEIWPGKTKEFRKRPVLSMEIERVGGGTDEGSGVGEDINDVPSILTCTMILSDQRERFGIVHGKSINCGAKARDDGEKKAFGRTGCHFGGDYLGIPLFHKARNSAGGDPQNAGNDPKNNPVESGFFKECREGSVDKRGNQGAQNGGETDGDRVGQGITDVTDGDGKGGPSNAVDRSHEKSSPHDGTGGFTENSPNFWDREKSNDDRNEKPTEKGLNNPECLP